MNKYEKLPINNGENNKTDDISKKLKLLLKPLFI